MQRTLGRGRLVVRGERGAKILGRQRPRATAGASGQQMARGNGEPNDDNGPEQLVVEQDPAAAERSAVAIGHVTVRDVDGDIE